ncbi:MAG TPA: formylglycine-generating enzyme family protein [Bacteroidales bacterium]|nr:formylglycine-generating enzyme family protein [Bacteroidales bacterium]HNS46507.1 formylglycine-generating enzyme family protein [Bacteroidales bacterium]
MKKHIFYILLAIHTIVLQAQESKITEPGFRNNDLLALNSIKLTDNQIINLQFPLPFFTCLINDSLVSSADISFLSFDDSLSFSINTILKASLVRKKDHFGNPLYTLKIDNPEMDNSPDSVIRIENLVPLGQSRDHVHITADGSYDWPGYLCRSRLFIPGQGPVGIVLPDNAWHLGFSDVQISDDLWLVALARRTNTENADVRRWWTDLKPGGSVEYTIYLDVHTGDWHRGLTKMFRERFLYDLPAFDNTLFEREDLAWVRHSYLMLLYFAWDHNYYDQFFGGYQSFGEFWSYDQLVGGFDIYTIWPTWPRLGMDQRNQWDMYRDLPGGVAALREQAGFFHEKGRKFFISYNPWDESTRKEDHFKGMEELLGEIDADGVCLDTRGASSYELQATADKVKPGIVMYSEGMAVPADMPGIVSGRVHDALYMPPPLNMNKFIKPDFAIFRVLQLAEGPLHRETAVAFFNGYGVEINTMRPGRPEWIEEEMRYLGKTTKILRENTNAFLDMNWTPLIPSLKDSIWVNRWQDGDKTIFTVYSLIPEGYSGPLIPYNVPEGYHAFSLWNHTESQQMTMNDHEWLSVDLASFDRSSLNSRLEGNVECIAVLPELLRVSVVRDTLYVAANRGNKISIFAGYPSYESEYRVLPVGEHHIPLYSLFRRHEQVYVVKLFEDDHLIDERSVTTKLGYPRLISNPQKTVPFTACLEAMVTIPAGDFRFYTMRDPSTLEPFMVYPDYSDTITIRMNPFCMDRYPVTNGQFYQFIQQSGYVPADTSNYLRHWDHGKPAPGMLDHPVVYVSLEDAWAYADWAGKRLPTEMEWQYAAQGGDMRKYPWGNEMDSTLCNYRSNHTTPVSAFPQGASPFGVEDMVGNVWQLIDQVYDNGAYYFGLIRGGSHYYPTSSIWYVTGGPLPVDHPEVLLMVAPSLDRCATIGFRCVVDSP